MEGETFKAFIVESSAGTNCDMSSYMQLKQVFIEAHYYSVSDAETLFSNCNVGYLSTSDILISSLHSFLEIKAVKSL